MRIYSRKENRPKTSLKIDYFFVINFIDNYHGSIPRLLLIRDLYIQ